LSDEQRIRTELLAKFRDELNKTRSEMEKNYMDSIEQKRLELEAEHMEVIKEIKKKQWCINCGIEAICKYS
jgi:hypothetical protein